MIRVYFTHPIRLTSSDLITSVFCRNVTRNHNSVTLHGVETLVSEEGAEWDVDGMVSVFNFNVAAIHTPAVEDSSGERKDIWQFLIGDLRRQRQFVDDQERIGGWLRDAQARWEAQHESEA